jgi:hypothetical protein
MPQAFSDSDTDASNDCAVVHTVSGDKVQSKVHLP